MVFLKQLFVNVTSCHTVYKAKCTVNTSTHRNTTNSVRSRVQFKWINDLCEHDTREKYWLHNQLYHQERASYLNWLGFMRHAVIMLNSQMSYKQNAHASKLMCL